MTDANASNAAASTSQAKEAPVSPPWGSDEEFKPEKAWTLIQNLRHERDQAKSLATQARSKLEEVTAQVAALTEENRSVTSSSADLTARLEAETAGRVKDRLLAAAGLNVERYAPLLTGSSEQEWVEQVKALTDLREQSVKTVKTDPAQSAPPLVDKREALADLIFGQ